MEKISYDQQNNSFSYNPNKEKSPAKKRPSVKSKFDEKKSPEKVKKPAKN